MTHAIVETDDAPSAIGPYSQAISAGQLLFTSGQIAIDPGTSLLVGSDDVAIQTDQVMKNLLAVIHAGGFEITDIVKATIFLKDMNDFGKVNTIYAEALQGHRPARATVEVSRLPKDALVEIEAICVKTP
jgi:2-iminobutanoate/2-iminopropanoate deaminase